MSTRTLAAPRIAAPDWHRLAKAKQRRINAALAILRDVDPYSPAEVTAAIIDARMVLGDAPPANG